MRSCPACMHGGVGLPLFYKKRTMVYTRGVGRGDDVLNVIL